MKSLAFFNVKGGVGKTTTATTVAHILATKFNKKVLLIDLDPQSNSSLLFGGTKTNILQILQEVFVNKDLSILETYENTVGNLLLDSDADVHSCIHDTGYPNLSLLPASLALAEIEEQMKADIKTPQQFRLKYHIEKIKDEFDYCILDLSPSINIININGLAMTDYVFTPLKCDEWGICGYGIANNLVQTVAKYNPTLKLGGCFFVQWNNQTSLAKQIRELMKRALGDNYIDLPIRRCVKVEEMTHEHKPLYEYSKTAKPTVDYIALTEKILKIVGA